MTPLTPVHDETLEAIRRLTVDGVAPTQKALRIALGLKFNKTLQARLTALVEKGAITMVPAKARSIRIVEGW